MGINFSEHIGHSLNMGYGWAALHLALRPFGYNGCNAISNIVGHPLVQFGVTAYLIYQYAHTIGHFLLIFLLKL